MFLDQIESDVADLIYCISMHSQPTPVPEM